MKNFAIFNEDACGKHFDSFVEFETLKEAEAFANNECYYCSCDFDDNDEDAPECECDVSVEEVGFDIVKWDDYSQKFLTQLEIDFASFISLAKKIKEKEKTIKEKILLIEKERRLIEEIKESLEVNEKEMARLAIEYFSNK